MYDTDPDYIVPPPNQMVKQDPFSQDCVACCCAMIVGQTAEEAHAWMGTESGEAWKDPEAYAYLLSFGIVVGEGFGLADPCEIEDTDILQSGLQLRGNPCLLSVKGLNYDGKEALHMVFWDGEKVWDSSPYVEGFQPLNEYKLSDVWRIFKMPDDCTERVRRLRIK